MQEKNIINGMLAVFLSEFFAFLTPLKWLAFCGIILIVADLRFGVMASKKRGEKIRTSRAIRRSVNKLIDYTCWVLLACALEHTFAVPFHIPLVPTLVMLIVYGVEIDSIFSNYFEYRDINIKVSIVGFVKKKIGDLFEIKEAQNDK